MGIHSQSKRLTILELHSVNLLKTDKIIIGHDGRTSNLAIFNAVASGIESNGKQVYYIGTVPTDVVYSLSGLMNLPGLLLQPLTILKNGMGLNFVILELRLLA